MDANAMKRILIDVDDVLGDFTSHTIATLKAIGGPELDPQTLTNWDLMTHIPVEWHQAVLQQWHSQGWCGSIPVFEGAQDAISALENIGHVTFVTAPMHESPHWMWERDRWLRTHFNASGRQIVFTEAKYLVRGDILVDDKVSNVIQWQQANPKKQGVLWKRPSNRSAKIRYQTNSWDEIVSWFSE